MSALISLELINESIENKVYNFGQPRIGNKEFSKFMNKQQINYWRFTHNKDIVPHLPPIHMDYYHSYGEVFETRNSTLIFCSDIDGEDVKCSQQYKLKNTNIEDHMTYLQYNIGCKTEKSTLTRKMRCKL